MYAVITGASSGIGKEIAYELAKRKIDLVIVARRAENLHQIKQDIEAKYQVSVVPKAFDLSDLNQCKELHEETKKYNPEIMINNAGFGRVGFFDSIPVEQELAMIDLNIKSLHLLTKLYVNSMEKGIILNVSSMAAFLPTPFMASYAATKAYVIQFSEAINYELIKQKRDLRVSTLCPGPVETEFSQVAESKMAVKGMSANKCARIAVKGIFKKKRIIIPGLMMKMARFFVRFIPTKIILNFSYKIQTRKK